MNRSYTAGHYLDRIARLRETIPGVAISTDLIAGFPTETEEDHRMTLRLLQEVRFDGAFMFEYYPRENTKAFEMGDHIPASVKNLRLQEVIDLQRQISYEINRGMIGREEVVLIEGTSKRSENEMMGRTDGNKTVIVPRGDHSAGEYVVAHIHSATSATLFGHVIGKDAKNAAGGPAEVLRKQALKLQSLHRYRQYRLDVKRLALQIRDR